MAAPEHETGETLTGINLWAIADREDLSAEEVMAAGETLHRVVAREGARCQLGVRIGAK